MTFAEGACEARSRREEEAMSGTSATTRNTEIARNPFSPKGDGGTASISLALLLRDAHRHRVVVASRTRRRRARHKRYRIYETRH